jgi:hypothetical protein
VSPNSQAVIPGGKTTFNVKVTSISGFSGSVTLGVASERPFPTGVTSLGFVPASITTDSAIGHPFFGEELHLEGANLHHFPCL